MSKSKAAARTDKSAIESIGTLVTGDFILDQHIYEGSRYHYADQKTGVQMIEETGGAGKLADLLESLFCSSELNVPERYQPVLPDRCAPGDTRAAQAGKGSGSIADQATSQAYRAYAFWRPKPGGASQDKQVWRCTEAMGFGRREIDRLRHERQPPCVTWPHPSGCPARPAMIVLSDGGMGFRDATDYWMQLPFATAERIVLKTAGPLTIAPADPSPSSSPKPGLHEYLSAHHADRLTVLITASELRRTSACIPAGLSWEGTFQGFLQELQSGGTLQCLTRCRNLIVSFDSEAAVHVRMQTPGSVAGAMVTFVYHASQIEEDSKNETEGRSFGYLTCFTAAVALGLALEEEDWLAPRLAAGIAAMQDLLQRGHGQVIDRPNGFPVQRIAEVVAASEQHLTYASAPFAKVAGRDWSFLRFAEPGAVGTLAPAHNLARLTALYGPVALANLPHFRVGNLITADRNEVTALRNLRQTLRRYRDTADPGSKPLSIGVFGPPGAGKSFSVREIAQNLLGKKADWLEFNLSQFDGPGDLIGAFHQIRDSVLQGRLPVAFFDEFDSQEYGWLQYLLAPMQDGRFQEGECTHTVSRCILVFAGGTSWTYDTFGPPESSPDYQSFRLKKGPDFKSRLDTFLNVVGPNPRTEVDPAGAAAGGIPVTESGTSPSGGVTELLEVHRASVGRWTMRAVEDDPWWPVRRALMLRNQLRLSNDEELEVDSGLLTAILETPRYHHGSRSLEKILKLVRGPSGLRPSFIPHASQLNLHTDAAVFLNLLDKPEREPFTAAVLPADRLPLVASAIHCTWEILMGKRKPTAPIPEFEELRSACKEPHEIDKMESNLAAAERMLEFLALIGLSVAPGTATPDERREIRTLLELRLELLAAQEHRHWMQWYFARGWTYHKVRKDAEFRHNCLQPYSALSDAEKNKDRNSIRHFQEFLNTAGYKIALAGGAPSMSVR